jgi:hypothetical protein
MDDRRHVTTPNFRRAFMSVKTAGPLQDEVDRSQVCNQDIEVDVQALFHDLRRYEHDAVRSMSAIPSEQVCHQLLPPATFIGRVASVEEVDGHTARLQHPIQCLRPVHGIDDTGSATAGMDERA